MNADSSPALIAVDIGNSRIALALFDAADDDAAGSGPLPSPESVLSLATADWDPAEVKQWLAPRDPKAVAWRIASVHRPSHDRLTQWLAREGAANQLRHLSHQDLPLILELGEPERVGIDRLLAAVAANLLRPPERPAIIVDLGTAITVDVVSANGAFCGGAILPGLEISARAMAEFTELLPFVEPALFGDDLPAPLGKNTQQAIRSGLYYGTLGATRNLVAELSRNIEAEPFVLVTGGAGPGFAERLGTDAHFEPHLVLAGIAISNRPATRS